MNRTLPLLAACLLAATSAAQTKLLRFPDVHGERVVFCYAGDLWLAPSTGGTATRLTAHPGLEVFPKFSPDGRWIAFTGQYDGDEQVYAVPAEGGEPRQLTFYPARGPLTPRWGYDNQVYGWSKDSQKVLFRSMREGWDLTDTRLFLVALAGGPAEALPMPVAGGGDLSPDEGHVVYSPLTRDFRTWKRYQGGWAQDLYVYHVGKDELEPVAHSPRTERDPMWIGDAIYFASDRTGTLNLFHWDVKSHALEQLTHSTTWDVRWPSKGDDGEIVYESDGELVLYDTKTRTERPLSIRVPDDGVSRRPARASAADAIEGYELSPKGERALFVARGDVFSVPIEKGPTRNLTNTPGVHERSAVWAPDGRTIAFLSDASGEDEVWRVPQDGSAAPERLTSDGRLRRAGLRFAPDGARIAFTDATGTVSVLELATGRVAVVGRDATGNVGDYSWSPDGRWLSLSLSDPNRLRSLHVWSAEDGSLRRVTDELWNESEPVFSPDGQYLWFLSDREFAPQLSAFEWNYAVNRTTSVLALALRKDVKHPFPPESDEVTLADGKKKEEGKKGGGKDDDAKGKDEESDAKPAPVEIDFDGLAQRVARAPLEADNYGSLSAVEKGLLLVRGGARWYGREPEQPGELVHFDLEERESTVLAREVGSYVLSHDGKTVLVSAKVYELRTADKGGKDEPKTVATDGMFVERVPAAEWREVFAETWRRYRDYFYVPNMHGYDWAALRERYSALLPHVAHRADLDYVTGEMVAELNVGHAYIGGGRWERPERAPVALLGATFAVDPASRRIRIARILAGDNHEERYRSPLTEIGVDVKAGDFLLAIDGIELTTATDPYQLLRNRADRPLVLTVGATPDPTSARKVTVNPLTSEVELFYLDFVLSRRAIVERLSGGRLGYLHIPDMGADGIREFLKWYYGQIDAEGLVVDDRNNGGGNVSQMILERLGRKLTGTEYSRHNDLTGTYPEVVFAGPMVCLLNENSASDGDIFPWMFRARGLGPLIGKRSWGGVVGITDHGPLIDGSRVSVPEFGHADAEGQWAVEGIGVAPDIEIENDPKSVLAGRDPQLERGIEELMKQLPAEPRGLPARPADPVKTK
jgi:tricorn protease